MHHHKMHKKTTGWNAMGLIECKTMIDKVNTIVVGEASNVKKLYLSKSHFIWDNYFSGD